MITDVEVEDYQALRKASIKLGRFTVVTGPTGSGKSGLIRAMRLVAFNQRGTSFVRHGAKLCQAALGFWDENIVVAIRRGGRGNDAYTLKRLEGSGSFPDDINGAQFTKLGGEVPREVQEILQLSEVNFAGQFDRPYLLTESGSQVARVLGELTNVTLVFDAAREASRRKLEASAELRRVQARLEELKAQARGFRGLKERRAAAQEAQAGLERMAAVQEQRDRLEALRDHHAVAVSLVRAAEKRLDQATPPSVKRLDELARQREELTGLVADLDTVSRYRATANKEIEDAHYAHVAAEDALHELLVAAGRCPTCGQSTRAPVTGIDTEQTFPEGA